MLGESKILLDDQRCSNKNTMYHIRAHFFMCSSRFFYHISQYVVCVQHHQRSVTNKSEVMGIGRTLSSEEIAQSIALANAGYCQRHIRIVLGCSREALPKNVKHYTDKRDILKISLVASTPCHNYSQRSSYHTVVWEPGHPGYSLASKLLDQILILWSLSWLMW